MNIVQESHGQVLLITPSGRLDSETAGELELVLHDAQSAGRRHFVIDMAAVSYVSSAGLRVLMALAKRLDGGIGSVRLCAMNASVKQVFDIAGFTAMFALYPDRKAALDRHPHMFDASVALMDAAAALLGAGEMRTTSNGDPAHAAAAAELLGVAPNDPDDQKRSTVIGVAVSALPSSATGVPSPWKRLFGK